MRANLDLTEGLISAEAVVLELGASIGRQAAQTSSRRPRRPRRRAAGRSPTF
jgi:adenylosuccinate lyase